MEKNSSGSSDYLQYRAGLVVFALLFPIALLLAALGSIIPARQTAQVSVVDVLRNK